MNYAGFWLRVVAALIDGILMNVVTYIVAMPLAVVSPVSDGHGGAVLLSIVLQWLYFTLLESSDWQATPGKRLLSLKVTDMDGNKIGWGQANVRYWSKILSTLIFFIGFIMVAFTEKKQGLHDLIAKTLVVKG